LSNFSRTLMLTVAVGIVAMIPILPREKLGRIVWRSLIMLPLLGLSLYVGLYLASQATGRDYFDRFNVTLQSLSPLSERRSGELKAWDSRIPSLLIELNMWVHSPLWGQGFAAQKVAVLQGEYDPGGFDHNSWTSVLVKTGAFGFIGLLLTMTAPIVMGYRMVKSRLDRQTVVMGALAYITGINGFVTATCTGVIGLRPALLFGLIAGAAFRAMEMAETVQAQLPLQQHAAELMEYEYIENTENGYLMPITEPEALAHMHRL
jgi:hypothetical protein